MSAWFDKFVEEHHRFPTDLDWHKIPEVKRIEKKRQELSDRWQKIRAKGGTSLY